MSTHWRGQQNPGHQRRLAQWRAIEEEFGESLADIIMGLRAQGNSWRTVAGALDTNLGTLQQWRHALKLPIDHRRKQYDPSSLSAPRRSDVNAQRLGYRDAPNAIADLRQRGLTLKEIGAKLGLHPRYVGVLSPACVKGIHNHSAAGRQVHRQQALARKHGGPEHPWSEDDAILFNHA